MVSAAASAKINLFLHIGDKRADGFHPLQSLAVFADCGDLLEARAAEGLTLSVTGPFASALAGESDNLVLRAARALAAAAKRPANAALTLTKNLPVASGLGGGSADSAAALRALTALWGLDRDSTGLAKIAASLGSDVPVCLAARPSWMEGRGEILSPVAALPRLSLLLVNPRVKVATADVFGALQTRGGTAMTLPQGRFADMADLLRFLESTANDLEAPAHALAPAIGTVLEALKAVPGALFTRMSGSGASCFALMPDDDSCRRGADLLRARQPDWWIMSAAVPETGIEHEQTGRDIGPDSSGL